MGRAAHQPAAAGPGRTERGRTGQRSHRAGRIGTRITGAPAWLKPTKFGVSVALYTLTLAWLLTKVRGHDRLVRWVALSTATAFTAELVLVVLQVVRGTTSHFNVATPFDSAIFATMGALVAVVFAGALVIAALLARERDLTGADGSAIRAGLGIAILGMAEAVLMMRNTAFTEGGAHTVGAPDGGPGLPLTGWSTQHGDLRVAHFVGLHALQVLPLVAYCLDRFTGIDPGRQRSILRVVSGGYACLLPLLTWQAERGLPLLHLNAMITAATATLAAVVVGLVLKAARHPRTSTP